MIFSKAIYDVECIRCFFSYTAVDYDSGAVVQYEISEYKNEWFQIKNHYLGAKYLINFNGVHYDDVLMCYLMALDCKNKTGLEIAHLIFACSQATIGQDKGHPDWHKKYRKYKYVNKNDKRKVIDLFLFWSKMTRMSKKLSLKSLACAMGMSIEEMPVHWDADFLTREECDQVLKYNLQDVLVTKELARRKKEDINLRIYAFNAYGFDCLSWDDVKLGLQLLVLLYSRRTNIPISEIMDMRTTYQQPIKLTDVLLPQIQFTEQPVEKCEFVWVKQGTKNVKVFKNFYALHQELLKQEIIDTNQIAYRVRYKDTVYDIKSGGLHSYHDKPELINPDKKKFFYRDVDASSYYPTMAGKWHFVPNHLRNGGFDEILLDIKDERVRAKVTDPQKAEVYKKALNGGFYGNTNNEYTPMQDLKCMLSITLNGQLMLLMFCEWCEEAGISVDMANTDGVTVICPIEKEGVLNEICERWQKLTRIDLEAVDYEKVYRTSINHYLALGVKGKVKQKGDCTYDNVLDGSNHFTIIPYAMKKFLIDGIPIEDTINSCNELWRFCTSQKVDKSYAVFHSGKEVNRLNRYFITNTANGSYIYKSKDGIKMEAMLKDTPVYICNEDIREANVSKYPIDRGYYIQATQQKVDELFNRLTLF